MRGGVARGPGPGGRGAEASPEAEDILANDPYAGSGIRDEVLRRAPWAGPGLAWRQGC